MKVSLRRHLQKLRTIKRSYHHPLIHVIHKKHHVSHKTLFYIKEYGPHAHVARTIIKESIEILLMASIISSFGGLALEKIKPLFIGIMPLIILLPTLNNMIGAYGTVVSSRFSTMLYEGRVRSSIWVNKELKKLFFQVLFIAITTALLSVLFSVFTSRALNVTVAFLVTLKLMLIVIADVAILVSVLFIVAVLAGLYFYHKKEDPNNFLIPITTSIADYANMALLALLVPLFF